MRILLRAERRATSDKGGRKTLVALNHLENKSQRHGNRKSLWGALNPKNIDRNGESRIRQQFRVQHHCWGANANRKTQSNKQKQCTQLTRLEEKRPHRTGKDDVPAKVLTGLTRRSAEKKKKRLNSGGRHGRDSAGSQTPKKGETPKRGEKKGASKGTFLTTGPKGGFLHPAPKSQ